MDLTICLKRLGPSATGPFVLASGTLTPSPSASSQYRGCIKLRGARTPLRSTCFPVYASTGLFGFGLLSSSCNTRYGWLVRPYPAGTLTLQGDAKLSLALLTSGVTGPRAASRAVQATGRRHQKRTRAAPVHAELDSRQWRTTSIRLDETSARASNSGNINSILFSAISSCGSCLSHFALVKGAFKLPLSA